LRNSAVTYSKTKSSRVRTVPIDPALETLIREHWKRHGPFTGAISSFRRALVRSGIQLPKGQASHALRHTFASNFIQKGGNILTLQKILGHSSLAMTMRYAHLAPENLAEAVRLSPLSAISFCQIGVNSHCLEWYRVARCGCLSDNSATTQPMAGRLSSALA
jgi:integrase